MATGVRRRVGARLHSVDHPAFATDVAIVVGGAAQSLSYIMVPKVESVDDVQRAVAAIDLAARSSQRATPMPLHVLIESPAAVHRAFDIAAHPRVESVSFGLMDFVSSHGGAIPSSAMTVRKSDDNATLDQFHHPLVVRAKLDIASACHAFGKVPSHCVVTEFRDTVALKQAATVAASALGFTRMWSIHPDQIRPILQAFSPAKAEVELAAQIVVQAQAQDWAPISVAGKLHDRASFRYFWQVLERAHQTGAAIPAEAAVYFSSAVH
jgi:citrate lyase subunit beta/citryl-CoA lyase